MNLNRFDEKRKITGGTLWKILIVSGIIVFAGVYVQTSFADEKTIVGEFIIANKVYMPNNNIKLVIYFNETESTKFFIFDNWDARHSIQLSNLVEGDRVKIYYKDYILRDCKEIVRIDLL